MKEGWEVKKLGEVMKLQSGENLPAKKMQDGIYPVYGGNGVSGYHNDYNMMGENIIIGRVGALCGNVRYLRDPFWLTDNGFKVILNKGLTVDLRYLTLFLNFANLRQYAKQTAQPVISNVALQEVPVILPPLPEQERIVEILDAEFAKIDAVKAGAEKSLQHAKDLFQAALKKELTPKEGWETKTIGEIAENLDYKRIPVTKKDRSVGIYPYYGASGIVDYVSDYLFDEELLLVSEDGANLLARSTPIAFSVSGKIWVNNHAHILRFQNIELQRFVEYFFASLDISEYVTGAAQPKFNQKALNNIKVTYPSTIEEQGSVVARIDALNTHCKTLQANYERTIALCDDMKQALLRKAFNGEL